MKLSLLLAGTWVAVVTQTLPAGKAQHATPTRPRVAKAPAKTPLARPAGTLLYQTKADYANRVPVLLSEDGQQIISYPAPSDVRGPNQTYPLPVKLAQGYLLDQRGIGLHVGFLSLTYADYARLPTAPSLARLQALLLDRDPLVTLCDCGPRSSYAPDPTAELNQLIARGQLRSRCKQLK